MNIIKISVVVVMLAIGGTAQAESTTVDALAEDYFEAWQNSQKPAATKTDLEHYLSFLTEDAAWQHIPYQTSDERVAGGKQNIRDGMTQWLGSHETYQAKMIRMVNKEHFIILEFESEATIEDGETGEIKSIKRHYLDVLELDDSRVAVVRRYDL